MIYKILYNYLKSGVKYECEEKRTKQMLSVNTSEPHALECTDGDYSLLKGSAIVYFFQLQQINITNGINK